METHLENNKDVEWFLKRIGNYTQDILITLHRDELILGRGRNKGIRYTVGISRQHALLKKTSNCQWKIKDLYSVNGVFVNACKITAGCFEPIKEFDIIGLGVADATSDEYFSFILCRRLKPQQKNYEDTPQNSDQSVDKSVKSKNCLNTKVKSQELSIGSKDFDEDENLTIVHNSASKAVDTDNDWVQFPKGKRKRKKKEIIIISSSDESDYDIEYIPRKKPKLRKKKHIISFDESKLMGEKVPLQSVLPDKPKQTYKELSNSCNEINKGKINNIVQCCSSSDKTLEDNRCSNSERSWNLPTHCTSNLEEAKEDRKPAIKQKYIGGEVYPDGFSAINSVSSSKESLHLVEGNKYIKDKINITNAHDHKKLLCSQSNDDEDVVSIKQGRDEFVDVPHGHIQKEAADISFEKMCGNENSVVQPNDQTYNVFKKEEHACGNNGICNGSSDLGNKLNIGVGDKELNDRLIWPPEPNDWNKENVSLLEKFVDVVEIEDMKVQLNKEEEKESKQVKIKSKEMTSPQPKPVEKKHQTPSIKLIKALPMRFRPNYVRDREDRFEEKMPKNSLEVPYSITKNKFKASKLASPVRTSNKTESVNTAEPKSKKFKNDMGRRLRSPSTIREDVASSGLRIPSSGKSNLKVPSSEIVKHCNKRFPLANNKVQASDKSKNAHKTQPIQRFKSRNEQFLQDLMVAPNSCKKKNEARKEREAISHSGWKCQTNGNPLKHFKKESA